MNKIIRIWNWLNSYTWKEYVLILLALIAVFTVAIYGIYNCVKFLEDLTYTYLIGL